MIEMLGPQDELVIQSTDIDLAGRSAALIHQPGPQTDEEGLKFGMNFIETPVKRTLGAFVENTYSKMLGPTVKCLYDLYLHVFKYTFDQILLGY